MYVYIYIYIYIPTYYSIKKQLIEHKILFNIKYTSEYILVHLKILRSSSIQTRHTNHYNNK